MSEGLERNGMWERIFLTSAYLLCASLAAYCARDACAGIETTRHNLSVTGPGPVKAVSETQICVFCHTPHGAVTTPLWNHTLASLATFVVPTSPTMKSIPQNLPDGDSRLCLSCHDGTVAIGSVVNLGGSATTITMQDSGTGRLTMEGKLTSGVPTSNYGTDLSGHHPVSLEVNDALLRDKDTQCLNMEIANRVCNPASPVKLLPTGNLYGLGSHTNRGVQCSSCHDPHEDPVPGTTMFLRAPRNEICEKCHVSCSQACPQ